MAEQLINEFTVNRPIEQAWPIITDVERIAPCLPGAQLQEIEGDTYRGVVKVKLGPINSQFKGEAHFVEQDDEQHRAVIKASGRDTQGRGNAEAEITAHAEALSPTSTRCSVIADLHITGKVAQFGRGILGDVSAKLMQEFSTNLNTMLDAQELDETTDADTAESDDDSAASTATSTGDAAGASEDAAPSPAPTVRRIEGPASEPIDLMEVGGGSILKRAAPVIIALVLILLLLRRRRS